MNGAGRFSKRSLAAVLLAISVVACALPSSVAQWVRTKTDVLLSPLADAGTSVSTTLRSRSQNFRPLQESDGDHQALLRTNDALAYALRVQEMQRQEQERRGREKNGLYGKFAGFKCELIEARVVANDSLPYSAARTVRSEAVPTGAYVTSRLLLTDRAKALPENLRVLAINGLVGRIVSAGEFTARLQLVTDNNFRIQAAILRNVNIAREVLVREDGSASFQPLQSANNDPIPVIAKGDGKNALLIQQVKAEHNVKVGDWLITMGDSRFMPDRVRIGAVSEIQPDATNPHVVTIKITPHAKLDTLREVYVVLPLNAPEE